MTDHHLSATPSSSNSHKKMNKIPTPNELNSLCDAMISYHTEQKDIPPLEWLEKLEVFRATRMARIEAEYKEAREAVSRVVHPILAHHFIVKRITATYSINNYVQAQIDKTVRSHREYHMGEVDKWKRLRC